MSALQRSAKLTSSLCGGASQLGGVPSYTRKVLPKRRQSLQCHAQISKSPISAIRRDVERFFEKYDVVSAGMGALTVTSYCVWRGQEPYTALSITLAATVTALVINEYFFESRR